MKRYAGTAASEGAVYGTLYRDAAPSVQSGRPAAGVAGAIIETAMQLRVLQAGASELGSDILEFQLALLEDDGLILKLLEASADGDAKHSVSGVFDREIASYRAAKNERFAARAADLADLRDRLVRALDGTPVENAKPPPGAILITAEMTPSRFLELNRASIVGIVDQKGSPASHVALLARAEGVPMLVGVGPVADDCEGRPAFLDANTGELVVDPVESVAPGNPVATDVPDTEGTGPAILPDGSAVEINLTVNALASLAAAPREWFDAIGLVRTELLIRGPQDLTRSDLQAELYRPLFDWAEGKPVTIRLLDGGGDKQVPGFVPPRGQGGFLGVRGARLLVRRSDVLRAQLAAILMAAEDRPVRILVPMVTLPEEMRIFRAEFNRAVDEAGARSAMLGMMVETPAAALDIAAFDADFFALGTNDLAQYALAASRGGDVLPIGDETPAPVLELVRMVVDHGAASGRPVSLCGDVSASPGSLGRLLGCGVRSFCVPARFAPRLKRFIRTGL